MDKRQKVVSYETARKLSEAGFPTEFGDYYWFVHVENEVNEVTFGEIVPQILLSKELKRGNRGRVEGKVPQRGKRKQWLKYTAPDAQDIGELLPSLIKYSDTAEAKFIERKFSDTNKEQWHVIGYIDEDHNSRYPAVFTHENEAEARAMLWLYLKEEKLI